MNAPHAETTRHLLTFAVLLGIIAGVFGGML